MKYITLEQAREFASITATSITPAYGPLLAGQTPEEQLRCFALRISSRCVTVNVDTGEESAEESASLEPLSESWRATDCIVDGSVIIGALVDRRFFTAPGICAKISSSEIHEFDPTAGFTVQYITVYAELIFLSEEMEHE